MDKTIFRTGLSRFVTGVTIITTHDEKGQPTGFTANSFTSLSLDPPLVLFCLSRNSNCFQAFTANPSFAVNILKESQQELAAHFATQDEAKFSGVSFRTGETGVPLIPECLANLECYTMEIFPGGDHMIFVGEVKETHLGEGAPLLFYRSEYHSI